MDTMIPIEFDVELQSINCEQYENRPITLEKINEIVKQEGTCG